MNFMRFFKNHQTRICLALFTILIACQNRSANVNLQQDKIDLSDRFKIGKSIAKLSIANLDEASGLANCRSNPDFLWAHNDSGGKSQLFLVSKNGKERSRFNLTGANNIDWEDMAVGPGPDDDKDYLFVADIGDNQAIRKQLTIYRVREPNLAKGSGFARGKATEKMELKNVESINFVYEDGPRDAEVLLVDPLTKNLYIVTKREKQVVLYRLAFPQSTSSLNTAEKVLTLPFTYMTAGDVSTNGNEVLIKNYQSIYYWKKSKGETLEQLLTKKPEQLAYDPEPQGEAIAWKTDGSGFYTLSEKAKAKNVKLYEHVRN